MKNTEEMRKGIVELLEEVNRENGGKEGRGNVVFSQRAKELVKEVADFSRKTWIYQKMQDQREAFWNDTKDATPDLIYGYMLDRVANAPTMFHANSSVILIIPKLDELLNGTGEEQENEE